MPDIQECGRCKTCQHYKPTDTVACKCPKMLYGYGAKTLDEPDQVRIENDEGWGMIPGPEFGCIHHEALE